MKKVFYTLLLAGAHFMALSQAPAFPFPNHTSYTPGSIKPNNQTQAQLDNEITTFYNAWKPVYLKSGCTPGEYYIEYINGNEICVSEGQGYGMVIVAYLAGYDANAQTYFDGLYRWYKSHPSNVNPVLMNWQQGQGCASDGNDAATDGDMDIAFGLLLADKQWGSAGTINYLQEALNIIAAIKQSEVFSTTSSLQLGDWAHSDATYKDDTRPSDFMYDHLRVYQAASGNNAWLNALNECYNLVDSMQTNYSAITGLLPDFIEDCDGAPKPAAANFLERPDDGHYYYNSCRTPWHLGVDYLINGDTRAKNACDKINGWLQAHTSNNTANIRSGYKLDGTNISGNNYQDLCFMAPFAVGACVNSANQAWLNSLWTYVINEPIANYDYYNNTIKLLCMIVMAGDYWVPQYNTTAIASHQAKDELRVWPNPTMGKISLSIPAGAEEVYLMNALGQKIMDLSGKTEIDFNDLKNGIYFILVKKAETTFTQKIILSR